MIQKLTYPQKNDKKTLKIKKKKTLSPNDLNINGTTSSSRRCFDGNEGVVRISYSHSQTKLGIRRKVFRSVWSQGSGQ